MIEWGQVEEIEMHRSVWVQATEVQQQDVYETEGGSRSTKW